MRSGADVTKLQFYDDDGTKELQSAAFGEFNPNRANKEAQWSDRLSFILACIGSAIGLGNFWRFPYLVLRYGGFPFFVPYLLGLFLFGIPLMQLEMTMGQVYRKGAIEAFGNIHPRFRGVGVANTLTVFWINAYYVVMIGWGNVYLIHSFLRPIPFSIYNTTGNDALNVPKQYFEDTVLMRAEDYSTKLIASGPFAGAFLTHVLVFFVLWRGTRFLSKAIYVTVMLPILMMVLLLIVGLTRPGAGNGLRHLFWSWNFSQFLESQMWIDGVSQVFFSISVANGAMVAYSSMNPPNSNCLKDAIIVSCFNCSFSFLTSLVVGTVIGYIQNVTSIEWSILHDSLSGTTLAFVAYPAALTLISDSYWSNILCVIFFSSIFFLGVDTVFSFVESVVFSLRGTRWFAHYTVLELTAYTINLSGFVSILYCADIGQYLLNMSTEYLGSQGLILCGCLECICTGWAYKRSDLCLRVGKEAVILQEIALFGGILVFNAILLGIERYVGFPYSIPLLIGLGCGVVWMAGFAIAAIVFARKHTSNAVYYLYLFQIDDLTSAFNSELLKNRPANWSLRRPWGLTIKFILPSVLSTLLFLGLRNAIEEKLGFSDYPAGYHYFWWNLFIDGASKLHFSFRFSEFIRTWRSRASRK